MIARPQIKVNSPAHTWDAEEKEMDRSNDRSIEKKEIYLNDNKYNYNIMKWSSSPDEGLLKQKMSKLEYELNQLKIGYNQLSREYSKIAYIAETQDTIIKAQKEQIDQLQSILIEQRNCKQLSNADIDRISRENAYTLREMFKLPIINESSKKSTKELFESLDGLFGDCISDDTDFCDIMHTRV